MGMKVMLYLREVKEEKMTIVSGDGKTVWGGGFSPSRKITSTKKQLSEILAPAEIGFLLNAGETTWREMGRKEKDKRFLPGPSGHYHSEEIGRYLMDVFSGVATGEVADKLLKYIMIQDPDGRNRSLAEKISYKHGWIDNPLIRIW